MATLMRLSLLALGLALAGCFAPAPTMGSDRAIALYHEGRAPSGALALRHESGARAASRPRRAAVREGETLVLTVDDAVAMAEENSARLAELTARVDAAEASVEMAGQYRNPELQVTQFRLDQALAGEPRIKPTIRFTPARPGEIDAKVAEARAAESAARADMRAEELAIESDVRWLFDDVMLLDAELAAADGIAEARRNLAARMKDRLDTATATAIDATMAELLEVEAEQDSAEKRVQRSTALAALLDRLGLDPRASVRVAGDPIAAWPPPELPGEEALVEAALRANPRIAIAAARIDGAEARAYLEHSKRWPWFTFFDIGYEFSPTTVNGLGWTVQTGIDLPLFNTNRGGARAADRASDAEKRALAAEVERVAREVRARLREVEAARALVTEFRGRALPVIERAGVEAKRSLEGANIDVVRALVVDERRVLVQLRFLRLLRRYRTAVAELRRALGGRLPTTT